MLHTIVLEPRRLVEVAIDFALTVASFSAAYFLVVGDRGTVLERHVFLVSLPAIVAARYLVFIPAGLYKGVWRYAGAREAATVVAAVALSELVGYGIIAGYNGFEGFPQSVYVIDALIAIVLVGASRFGERALARVLTVLTDRSERRRTMIVGAGRGGRSLLRELRETPGEQVAFVDDDPRLRRRRQRACRWPGRRSRSAASSRRPTPTRC